MILEDSQALESKFTKDSKTTATHPIKFTTLKSANSKLQPISRFILQPETGKWFHPAHKRIINL